MATTLAAYYNISASSRNPSTSTTTSSTSSSSKKEKIMSFLSPRMPVHEPLTPTHAGKANRKLTVTETEYPHAHIYDSVLRRPLFSKAKAGNEQTMVQKVEKERSRAERQKKAMASVDRVYTVHMTGEEKEGLDRRWQRGAYGA